MSLLIGLIPALGWGLMPLAVAKIGGKPSNQILGTTAGTFLAALAVLLIARPETTGHVFLFSFLSGALWVVGQIGQYTGFARLGVARTMPISTGLQLVGTTLLGVFVFNEWAGSSAKWVGFGGLLLVVVGVYLTTVRDGGAEGSLDKRALLILLLTTAGYLAYSAIPQIVDTSGTEIFFPQSVGMLAAALVYVFASRHAAAVTQKVSWRHILSGLFFAVASLTYLISADRNGIATGFVLSQLSVVISTIGGIVFLKEHRSRRELILTGIGLALIIAGAGITAFFRH
ncbi:MAG: GRP family sugar transporter [Planctomycetes bacterium]|nr:GRP family sugar transporter [Planctomycetota bacterium]